MKSFRTELEDNIVEQDIIDLEKKIYLAKHGKIDDEKFRSLRLARGVYGQRQLGVQMVRIKLPYGKVSSEQLYRLADVSDKYSTGNLHITTRQDIQIHYVSLDRTPELWSELEKDDITLREACGNTVRNVTASEMAGVDPHEPFDITPYADTVFKYFLRNPICQEMGRKFKIAFSSSDEDTALTYMHDLGFIPKVQEGKRGFKVLLGGGLGSQPREADTIHDFLPENQLIPVIEGVIRIFDRYGERAKRMRARLKFLLKDIGLEEFLKLVKEETNALPFDTFEIPNAYDTPVTTLAEIKEIPTVSISNPADYALWKQTNVFPQKQEGLYAVGIRVTLGNFTSDKARQLGAIIKKYGSNELRFTLRQNILLRDIREELLPIVYTELEKLGFVQAGFNSTVDITACPGTDTCNLGIASSTGIAKELERVITAEYPQYLQNKDLIIKISGCMNACGQHNMAHIGFQGMSMKAKALVLPALQVLLGGSTLRDGKGRFADKVIKIPAKRGAEALRTILNDFEANQQENESFIEYYDRNGQKYFYNILKPLTDISNLQDSDFVDWGNEEKYVKAIGVGECAGVVVDLVSTLFKEGEEKLELAAVAFKQGQYADAIYHAYAAMINTAKASLTAEGVNTKSYATLIKEFDEKLVASGKVSLNGLSFHDTVYEMKKEKPTEAFANHYIQQAVEFYQIVENQRKLELNNEK